MNNFYLAEPQQILPPKNNRNKLQDKECNPKKARFPQKIPGNKLQKKHFTKMQKHVGLASTKKTTKQDGTHMTIRSQITIPTSIFPTTHTTISPAYNHPYSITHTTQHTVTTTHSPSQLYIHLYYTLKTPLTHTTYYWSTFHNYSNIQLITINAVTLHTTNPYIYKQTNPPLQQALAP